MDKSFQQGVRQQPCHGCWLNPAAGAADSMLNATSDTHETPAWEIM